MFPMVLVQIVIVLAVIGLLLWAIAQLPIDPTIARIIRVVAIVAVCFYLIFLLASMVGSGAPLFPTGRLR